MHGDTTPHLYLQTRLQIETENVVSVQGGGMWKERRARTCPFGIRLSFLFWTILTANLRSVYTSNASFTFPTAPSPSDFRLKRYLPSILGFCRKTIKATIKRGGRGEQVQWKEISTAFGGGGEGGEEKALSLEHLLYVSVGRGLHLNQPEKHLTTK